MSYTLTVNFTLATPDPGSYRVRFWPVSNPAAITVRVVSTSPFVETGLLESAYAGTIEASCGGGQYSSAQSFSTAYDFYYYTATKYDCLASCAQVGTTDEFVVRSAVALTPASNLYYKVGDYTYKLGSLITPDPGTFDVDLDGSTSDVVCSTACGTPAYNYYTGILCGGAIVESFRSLTSIGGSDVVKAWCDTCGGGSYQCFDNVSPTLTPNTNDVITVYTTCLECNTGSSSCDCYTLFGAGGASLIDYTPCGSSTPITGVFNEGDTVVTEPGSAVTVLTGGGSLLGPFACVA